MGPQTVADTPAEGADAQPASDDTPLFRFSDIFGSEQPATVVESAPEVSNEPPADDDEESEPEAEPAPEVEAEGVKVDAAPEPPEKPLSRRERERQEHQQKITELEARVASFETPEYRAKLRDEILAEETQRATEIKTAEQSRRDAEMFAEACSMPDADPRLAQEAPGKGMSLYDWREGQKTLRSWYPEAVKAIHGDAELRIAQAEQRAKQIVDGGWGNIRQDIIAQIDASTTLPNVDKKTFEADGSNWRTMAEHIHAAGAAWKESQVAEQVSKAEERATAAEAKAAQLEKENGELRAQALGDRRAPAVVGRTAGGDTDKSVFDPAKSWRGNLRDAFDFPANGTG